MVKNTRALWRQKTLKWGECKETLTHRVGPKGSIFTLLAPPEEGGTRCAPLIDDSRASCTQWEIVDGLAKRVRSRRIRHPPAGRGQMRSAGGRRGRCEGYFWVGRRLTRSAHGVRVLVPAERDNPEEEKTLEHFSEIYPERENEIHEIIEKIIVKEVRRLILHESIRPDGRQLDEIRPLSCEVGILPRCHGSGLFKRGQTQVLTITTLGAPGDGTIRKSTSAEIILIINNVSLNDR